jgi:hypothetical protein
MWDITDDIRMRRGRPGTPKLYGQRYIIDFDLVRQGGTVSIRSTWIVRIGEDWPRLTSPGWSVQGPTMGLVRKQQLAARFQDSKRIL